MEVATKLNNFDKKNYMKIVLPLFLLTMIFCFSGCFSKELRGNIKRSKDKLTYLVFDYRGENQCEEIIVDGKIWPYKIGEKGSISSGEHTITCGGALTIIIKEGTTFHFNYWGP